MQKLRHFTQEAVRLKETPLHLQKLIVILNLYSSQTFLYKNESTATCHNRTPFDLNAELFMMIICLAIAQGFILIVQRSNWNSAPARYK